VRLLVIWDGSLIHRCQEVKAFLASPTGQGVRLEQLPPYDPELDPDEGVWNYLKRVELKNIICHHLGQLSFDLASDLARPSSASGKSLTSSVPASLRLAWFNSSQGSVS
jgi:transposase